MRVVGPLGAEQAVERACGELTHIFDTRANRITLKVEVPSEQHFYIIGRKVRLFSDQSCSVGGRQRVLKVSADSLIQINHPPLFLSPTPLPPPP